jgi:hypothetical protein
MFGNHISFFSQFPAPKNLTVMNGGFSFGRPLVTSTLFY